MVPVRIEAVGQRAARWGGGDIWRIDFGKAQSLRGPGAVDCWKSDELPKTGDARTTWTVPHDQDRVIFVRGRDAKVCLGEKNGLLIVEAQSGSILLNERAGQGERVYTSGDFESFVQLFAEGKIFPAAKLSLCQGGAFQGFVDTGMTASDWGRLGFRPPQGNRPALDIGGGCKYDDESHICIPHLALPELEEACPSLWDHFVDSSHCGVYFSRLEVGKTVHVGPTAGWAAGTVILPQPAFAEGVPYRRVISKLGTSSEGEGSSASAVRRGGVQYLSFDPLAGARGADIQVIWRTDGTVRTGIFADGAKYLPASEVRRSHYVTPCAKTFWVWPAGTSRPVAEPCLAAPGNGGKYRRRPCGRERSRLVALYGRDAVPRNFDRYTEGQIARKSELLRLTKEKRWIHIPSGEDGDKAVERGYAALGETSPLGWRHLRQIVGPSDIETDPFGGGLYARLPERGEILEGEYLRKLVAAMRREGWGFLVREITENGEELRKALVTMALSHC